MVFCCCSFQSRRTPARCNAGLVRKYTESRCYGNSQHQDQCAGKTRVENSGKVKHWCEVWEKGEERQRGKGTGHHVHYEFDLFLNFPSELMIRLKSGRLWLRGRASIPFEGHWFDSPGPRIEVSLGKITAPDELVSTLHGSHRHQCMSVWITVSRFGQKHLLNALKCKCKTENSMNQLR